MPLTFAYTIANNSKIDIQVRNKLFRQHKVGKCILDFIKKSFFCIRILAFSRQNIHSNS